MQKFIFILCVLGLSVLQHAFASDAVYATSTPTLNTPILITSMSVASVSHRLTTALEEDVCTMADSASTTLDALIQAVTLDDDLHPLDYQPFPLSHARHLMVSSIQHPHHSFGWSALDRPPQNTLNPL